MNWPQITWIVLLTISLSLHFFKHGEPLVQKTYHFGFAVLVASIHLFLLYMGGFFGG